MSARLGFRLRVWWRRPALTEALAGGADPDGSPELTHVARELIGMRWRRRLATGLDRVLRTAAEPPLPHRTAVPLNLREVVAARDELAALADALRAVRPVPVHAVAQASVLLTDGTSPLYGRASGGRASQVARTARIALDDPIA
jgi:hypothetical protein